ncbi:MAG: hypothetical protein JWQ35_2235 [Bacteriovoracaceae bacterium]|nr:hypothetical protein [Bacteriovoracaceae bacterium]
MPIHKLNFSFQHYWVSFGKANWGPILKSKFILSFLSFILCALLSADSYAGFFCRKEVSKIAYATEVREPKAELVMENIKSYEIVSVTPEEASKTMGVRRAFKLGQIKTEPGKRFIETEIFKKPAAFMIGLDVTGNTHGHEYLAASDKGSSNERKTYAYDGRLFFNLPDVVKGDWHFSDGVIIRAENIPEENRAKLLAYFEAVVARKELKTLSPSKVKKLPNVRAATCIASACKVIYNIAGFKNNLGHPWFPSTFLKHLAEHRLIGADGKPVEFEIYTLNADYKTFWNNLPQLRRIFQYMGPVFRNPETWGKRQFQR